MRACLLSPSLACTAGPRSSMAHFFNVAGAMPMISAATLRDTVLVLFMPAVWHGATWSRMGCDGNVWDLPSVHIPPSDEGTCGGELLAKVPTTGLGSRFNTFQKGSCDHEAMP